MHSAASWTGTPAIKGSSEAMRMALLTVSLVGIQFTWGIEMTYCTPYLLELGLTKSMVSLVWIAGPLSGLIMQPIVGVLADKSRSKYGRRRPYMVGGTIVVSAALLVLGWTKEIVGVFISLPKGASKEAKEFQRGITIGVAVLSIYAVDFAINAVQASCRSLIVDTLPISKQQMGSAWASRMIAIGHLIGYAAGALDLRGIFGTMLGDTQFKQLTVISAIALCISIGITSYAITERVLVVNGKEEVPASEGISAVKEMLMQLLTTASNLPRRIQMICWVQFWCWIGWFPFLFYSTTWVGEIYLRYNAPVDARESKDTLGQIGRIGSMSLIVFSIVTFLGSVILPWVVRSPEDEKVEFTPRPPAGIAPILEQIEKYKPSLLTAWMVSHMIFACSMILAPFVTSLRSATATVAVCGIPWALACWAPFTFIGIEINKLNAPLTNSHYRHVSTASIESEPGVLRLHHSDDIPSSTSASTGELAGVYLGILNLYCTLPQFVGTFISWVVFSLLEPGKSPELAKEAHPDEHHSTEGPNAIAVCLFIGALAAVGAAYATNRLKHIP
ncbi:sucrose transport protein-like protein [Rhizodiscina lignyota]|uniref:Sucrose transport protein-like protein n=1 Tax=Rhizodiscina lignyota TaxID=1504668 RepID=A0A9P4IBD0_9PEZI|nr:sucrose transport protein-like protein [Rhizodiscina lignyota]